MIAVIRCLSHALCLLHLMQTRPSHFIPSIVGCVCAMYMPSLVRQKLQLQVAL